MDEATAKKLQRLLSPKIGRELTNHELEKIYKKLMTFSFALVALAE